MQVGRIPKTGDHCEPPYWANTWEQSSYPLWTLLGGPNVREFGKVEIDIMQSQKIIETAQTERAGLIEFASKMDRFLPFFVDYWSLNVIINRDFYSLPWINECIVFIGETATFFSSDVNSGSWKEEVEESDQDKTAFTSQYGLYRFVRMPFVLESVSDTFPRATDVIKSPIKW